MKLQAMEVVDVPARPAAVIAIVVPRGGIGEAMRSGIGELMAALAAMGRVPAGPLFAHHLRMSPENFDFEVGLPVDGAVAEMGRVRPGVLPGGRVARAVYRGPYEGLAAAWGEFKARMVDRKLTPGPGLWEVFEVGMGSGLDPAAWRTELVRPVVDRG